jgi:hypothetical protein
MFTKTCIVDINRTVYTWAMCKRTAFGLTEWDVMRAAYGLNPRIQMVWAKIPLSFVVDWFVSIGRFLAQFDGRALELPYQVLQSGTSYKDVVTYKSKKVMLKDSPDYAYIGDSGVATCEGHVTKTTFIREPGGLPWGTGVIEPIQTRLPNFGQVGTLLELIYAFMR